jgi:hypothetical protein
MFNSKTIPKGFPDRGRRKSNVGPSCQNKLLYLKPNLQHE